MSAPTTTAPSAADVAQAPTDDLCWLLSRASWTLSTEMTAALEDVGISPRAHHVLSTAMRGERTQTEIAKLVGLDKTTMVVTLDDLEKRGLAERRPSATDRRARVVAVTPAGERVVAEGDAILARVREDVLAALPDEERDAFLSGLRRLVGGRLGEPVPCTQPVRRRAPR